MQTLVHFKIRPAPLRAAGMAICVASAIAPSQAWAYADPGTGTMLWQMLLAAMVGVSFYARSILGWISRKWKR